MTPSVQRDYRVRIGKLGGGTLSSSTNVDLTFSTTEATVRISGVDSWGGVNVRPLEGRSNSRPWQVKLLDSSTDAITSELSGSSGRMDILRRLLDLSVRDGGSTASYSVQATGRITDVSLAENPVEYVFTVQDERLIERETEIFTEADTTPIYPYGLRPDEMHYPAHRAKLPLLEVKSKSTDEDIVELEIIGTDGESGGRNLPPVRQVSREVVQDDVLTGTFVRDWGQGNFDHLRFRRLTEQRDFSQSQNTAGTDHEVENFGPRPSQAVRDANAPAPAEKLDENLKHLRRFTVVWSGSTASVGDQLDGFLYAPTRPPDERMPLHLGWSTGLGSNGFGVVDPIQVIKDEYDSAGVRYASTIFSAYDSSTNPAGLIGHPDILGNGHPRLRITRTWNLGEFVEATCAEFGLVPFVNPAGEVAIRRVMLPAADLISSTTALFTIDDSNIADAPATFEHPSKDQVTRVIVRWDLEPDSPLNEDTDFGVSGIFTPAPPFRPNLESLDDIRTEEQRQVRNHDRSTGFFGVHEQSYDFIYLHDRKLFGGRITGFSGPVFDRYGDGPVMREVSVMATATDVGKTALDIEPGEWVVMSSTMAPDPETQSRGGARLAQVMTREFTEGAPRFRLLDGGPNSQPLTAPQLSLAKTGTAPASEVEGALTNIDSGAQNWTMHVAWDSTSEPAEDSGLWTVAGRQSTTDTTMTFSGLPEGEKIWGRARVSAISRITSSWSTSVSATLDSITAPSGLGAGDITGCSAVLTWTPGSTILDTEVLLDGVRQAILGPGARRYELVCLEAGGSASTAAVRHIGRGSGVSDKATASFSPASTDAVGPTPVDIRVVRGNP